MIKKIDILEKVHESGFKFLPPLALTETYNIAAKEASKLFPSPSAVVFIMQDRKLTKVASFPEKLQDVPKPRTKGSTYLAYIKRRVIVVKAKNLNSIHPEFKKYKYQFAIYIPISHYTKSIGTLRILTNKKKPLSQKELQSLKIFGSYISLAIHKAKLFEDTKEALSTRDLFISIAAHEFRTPLTSISGYVQLLYNKLAKQDTTESRWIKQLYSETNRLTHLVQELLEINRIRVGKLQFSLKEVSLTNIIMRALDVFQFSYPQKKILFKNNLSSNDDIVIADYEKLIQVITNILDNAAKFSPTNTIIVITLTQSSPNLIIEITDSGIGIAKEDLLRIFKGFYKKIESQREGMGVGLLLAKHILAYHHGTIHVTSELKKGTTIQIELPKRKT